MIDGTSGVMTQADAILKYLAHKYPDAKLGDDGTLQDGYELDHWLAFFTGDVHPAFFPYFSPKRYSSEESESALSWVKQASYKLIDKVFTHLNAHLDNKNYIVGNHRTIADPYAFAMIRWGNNLPKPLSKYPSIYRFYQQLREDEGVKRAMEQQGIN
jgi:glutathione S-transferase